MAGITSFTYKNGKPFDQEKLVKRLALHNYDLLYGITKEANKGNSATHLAINTLGSVARNIPPRDSVNLPVRRRKDAMLNVLVKEFKNEVKNKECDIAMENALNKTGFYIINNLVRPTVLSNGNSEWDPLSPRTIADKNGSDQMLIKSGTMFNCYSWRLEKK